MKLCLRLLIPAGGLLLVLPIIAAACGGGDEELTLEEFFQQSDAIDDDFQQRFNRLSDEYPGLYENLQEYKAFYGESGVLLAEFIDELEHLNPPPEVADAFDQLLTAGSVYGEFQQELGDRLEGVESFAEAQQSLGEFATELDAADERYLDACQSLDKIAHANAIVVSFDCAIGSHTHAEPVLLD